MKQELIDIAHDAELKVEHFPDTLASQSIILIDNYKKKIIQEIGELQNIIQKSKRTDEAPDYEELKKKVFEKITTDLETIAKVNGFSDDDKKKLSIPVKSNKIKDSILLAKNFLEENFDRLYDGELPNGYIIEKPEVLHPISHDEKTIWGSAKAVQLQVALFYMATAISKKETFAELEFSIYKKDAKHSVDQSATTHEEHFADQSAIAHIEPISDEVNLSHIENIKKFSWFFSDGKTSKGLLTIPGGYTFGGGRGSARNRRDINNPSKEQPTHDCSSFVADLCKVEKIESFSTADQYVAYQYMLNNNFIHPALNNAQEIVKKFEAQVASKENLAKGNSVYAHRTFKPNDDNLLGGAGGHTGIVLGSTNIGEVLITSCTREIDTKAEENLKETLKDKFIGYGIQEVSKVESIQGPNNNIRKPFFMAFNKGNSR